MNGVDVVVARFAERVVDIGGDPGGIELFDIVMGIDITQFEAPPQHVHAGGEVLLA